MKSYFSIKPGATFFLGSSRTSCKSPLARMATYIIYYLCIRNQNSLIMETREYFEKVMQDYNQNRKGRSLRCDYVRHFEDGTDAEVTKTSQAVA